MTDHRDRRKGIPMSEHESIHAAIQAFVTKDEGEAGLPETQEELFLLLARHHEELPATLAYLLSGWRTTYQRSGEVESALREARDELERIRDGGLVGAMYVSEGGMLERHDNGHSTSARNVIVACRGSLLEVPMSAELSSETLTPRHSLLWLDQQCRYVTRLTGRSVSSSFGRIGTVVRLVGDRRACVRFDNGQGEMLVSLSSELSQEAMKPEETAVRVIEVTNNFLLAVEIIPDCDGDELFADGLDALPAYGRNDVVGQDRAWEELETLLLHQMRNPAGLRLYNLNGHGGALARNHGVFISGPTGTGKSMLAAAALHEVERLSGTKVLVKYVTGAYFASKWFGESEHRALSLYRRLSAIARRTQRVPVVVIDEASPAFMRRSAAAADNGGVQAHSDLTNTLLHIIGTTDVLTIAIDNNSSCIDPAILRPGRLPLVRAERPGYRQCVEIARRNLAKTLISAGETPQSLAMALCDFIFLSEQFLDLVRVRFAGGTQRAYAGRDLVTGADLVEGIITPAAQAALKRDETAGATLDEEFLGIRWDDVREACIRRFNSVIGNIDRNDAGDYVDIPEGSTVLSVEKHFLIF